MIAENGNVKDVDKVYIHIGSCPADSEGDETTPRKSISVWVREKGKTLPIFNVVCNPDDFVMVD